MNDASAFSKHIPGFDFLQSLAKNAGAGLPGIGQWIAPTLDPAEIEKRIEELKTVQFWLEQNVRMVGATIQALEVQRMTLTTLKTMNVQMGDLRDSLRIKVPGERASAKAAPKGAAAAATPGAVDPMQWWGALTSQFTQLAASAMKDGAADAARTIAGSALRKSFEGAAGALRQAAAAPGKAAAAATGAGQAPARPKAPRRRALKR